MNIVGLKGNKVNGIVNFAFSLSMKPQKNVQADINIMSEHCWIRRSNWTLWHCKFCFLARNPKSIKPANEKCPWKGIRRYEKN